jgi:nuclear-control-of-ATPase protein 2
MHRLLLVVILVIGFHSSVTSSVQFRFPGRRKDGIKNCDPSEPLFDDPPVFVHENVGPEIWTILFDTIKNIVLYKPPVGIVGVLTFSRLILSGRLFRLDTTGTSEKEFLKEGRKRLGRRHRGRSLDLDKNDLDYQKHGGVERVRRRLCLIALTSILDAQEHQEHQEHQDHDGPQFMPLCSDDDTRNVVAAAMDALKLTYPPGGSRSDFVENLIHAQVKLETNVLMNRRSKPTSTNSTDSQKDLDKIIQVAAATAQVRILDGLLRICRDQLLKTSYKLSRAEKHWRRRVSGAKRSSNVLLQYLLKDSIEGIRLRLSFAEAAYAGEIVRLGKVVDVLMQHPVCLDDSRLSQAVINTIAHDQQQQTPNRKQRKSDNKVSKWSWPSFSRFGIRYNPEGRGRITFHQYDENLPVSGPGAMDVLFAEDTEEYLEKVRDWTTTARNTLCGIVRDIHSSSIKTTEEAESLRNFEKSWYIGDFQDLNGIEDDWMFIFENVRDLSTLRRLGEGTTIRLRDTTFFHWIRQWDLVGIPSAALHIGVAFLVHKQLAKSDLNWLKMREGVVEGVTAGFGIFRKNFWDPIYGLVMEIMNRGRNNLLQGIAADDEAQSLDNMLRDLGFGDGTPETRHTATQKASRQYESDMKYGLVRHALGGRLVRLILIQVQQLKVGMLVRKSARASLEIVSTNTDLTLSLSLSL